jgi:phosphopantothenoylcysteine synthetase/decarboxylase
MAVVGVVGCAAGGVLDLRGALVEPLIKQGHTVSVTLTPSAGAWLEEAGETALLRDLTGFDVRSTPRLPSAESPHPAPDLLVAAPATANTVAKLALGIGDNQALTVLCENIAYKPIVLFPRINAAHARQPSWDAHVSALRGAGVRLVYGEDVWPLYEPRQGPADRPLPWTAILEAIEDCLSR